MSSGASADMRGRRLHFIAIGGAGMSGLALVAAGRGATVTGSDRAAGPYFDRLREAGIDARIGHDAANVPDDAEIVVSSAIGPENPELEVASARGQRILHRSEMLAELCAPGRLIAVAGAHGKTTTTGMIVWALRALGADPTFFIGGEIPGFDADGRPANAGSGSGEWIVAEADESDGSFLRLDPEIAVVTNVELDHHANWKSEAELVEAFARFTARADGLALLDDPALVSLATSGAKRVQRFGSLDPSNRVGGDDLRLAIPGRHNRLNAAAAIAALELAGFDSAAATAALADFPGMVRRLELKGKTAAGATVYDDYGHHPTEVGVALAALRELAPRRLVAVFQPHLFSRTKALAARFGRALALADEVVVADVYPAREEPVGELAGVSGLDVVRATADARPGIAVTWAPDLAAAARAATRHAATGDIIVTIGAGNVVDVADRLVAGAGQGEGEGEGEG